MNASVFFPAGDLTFSTVNMQLLAGLQAIQQGAQIISLAHVSRVDSSALSLMLEWQRHAERTKTTLRYIDFSPELQSLAKVYGVETLLQLTN